MYMSGTVVQEGRTQMQNFKFKRFIPKKKKKTRSKNKSVAEPDLKNT